MSEVTGFVREFGEDSSLKQGTNHLVYNSTKNEIVDNRPEQKSLILLQTNDCFTSELRILFWRNCLRTTFQNGKPNKEWHFSTRGKFRQPCELTYYNDDNKDCLHCDYGRQYHRLTLHKKSVPESFENFVDVESMFEDTMIERIQ